MNRHFLILSFLIPVIFFYNCDNSPTTADQIEINFDPINLDVRIFLMESPASPGLTATVNENEVKKLMEGVNEVWEQANIQWEIERIQIIDALNGEDYERMLRGEIRLTTSLLLSVIPDGVIKSDSWDIFLINELTGGIGGVYLSQITSVIQPETDPLGVSGLQGGLTRILAHELGHSLTLNHVDCTSQGNLMAAGCPQGIRT